MASPAAVYAQVHLHLAASDAAVEYVRAQYLPANQAAHAKVTAPTDGAILKRQEGVHVGRQGRGRQPACLLRCLLRRRQEPGRRSTWPRRSEKPAD